MRNFNKLLLVPVAVAGLVGQAACSEGGPRPDPVDTLTNVHLIGGSRVRVEGHEELPNFYNAVNFGAPIRNGSVEIGTNGYNDPLDGGFLIQCVAGETALRVATDRPKEVGDDFVAASNGDVLAVPNIISEARAHGIPQC